MLRSTNHSFDDSRVGTRSPNIDVTVQHPSAPSRSAIEAGVATRAAENDKRRKYLGRVGDAKLLTFAVETYGAFGKEATQILGMLRSALLSQNTTNFSGP